MDKPKERKKTYPVPAEIVALMDDSYAVKETAASDSKCGWYWHWVPYEEGLGHGARFMQVIFHYHGGDDS